MLGKSVSGSRIRFISSSWSGRSARATPLALRQASLILGEMKRAVAPMATPQNKYRQEKGLARAQPAPHKIVNWVSEETKAPEMMAPTRRGLGNGGGRNKGSKGSTAVEQGLRTRTGSQKSTRKADVA